MFHVPYKNIRMCMGVCMYVSVYQNLLYLDRVPWRDLTFSSVFSIRFQHTKVTEIIQYVL